MGLESAALVLQYRLNMSHYTTRDVAIKWFESVPETRDSARTFP
jgi:hypothetical protein